MRSILRICAALRRKSDGSTAIETAFILPIFFALVFSCFEIGFLFFRQAVVEDAVYSAARTIRVGQAVSADYEAEDPEEGECETGGECFFDEICESVSMLGDCEERLSVEVRQFDSFEDLVANGNTAMTCPNTPGYDSDAQAYEPGDRDDVIRVRICYLVNVLNPALGISLERNDDGTRSIVSTFIHRNEPFLGEDDLNPNDALED